MLRNALVRAALYAAGVFIVAAPIAYAALSIAEALHAGR